jgi:hypothetical protein
MLINGKGFPIRSHYPLSQIMNGENQKAGSSWQPARPEDRGQKSEIRDQLYP